MGGKSAASKATKYLGVQVQQSIKGAAIGRGWGTFKASCNLLDYLDFKAKAVKSAAGGKGGGSTTSYSYSATVLMGVVSGPIAGIRAIYRDSSVYTTGSASALAQAGLSLATGAIGQSVWGYLTTNHSTHALGYSGMAYVYAPNYALNSSASLPNHSFEIQSTIRQVIAGVTQDDANPADVLADFIPSVPQWPTGALGDLTAYHDYCLASGLLLSPFLDAQRQASDFLMEILTASNADCVESEGVLKVIPLGDTAITANGVTYTPNLTPAYDLTWDQIVSGKGDDPIKWDFKRPSTAYNYVQVECLDRTQQYATDVVPAYDQANIDQYGMRKADPVSLHCICDTAVAAQIAQLMVQSTCNVRRTCQFSLPETFGLLDPLDLITVPLRNGGRRLVRINAIDEAADGELTIHAEEMLVGLAYSAGFSRQTAGASAGNQDADPGNVSTPVFFAPPASLLNGDLEIWAAIAGTGQYWGGAEVWISVDGSNYTLAGSVEGGARYGQVTGTTLGANPDPDTTHSLSVDLSASNGQLAPATTAEADAFASLCLVGSELIAYRDATLTSANHYTLGYLRRGVFGTAIAGHAAGANFVRLDQAVFKYPFLAGQVGSTIYVKLRSFNVYGRAYQDLSTLSAYTVTLATAAVAPATPANLRLATPFAGALLSLICDAAPGATGYKFKIYRTDGATLVREIDASVPVVQYTADMAAADGIDRSYRVAVIASNAAGDSAPSAQLGVSNAAPATVTGEAHSVSATAGQATITCNPSGDADLAGYAVFYSPTSGFDPTGSGFVVTAAGPSVNLYGLAAGSYYYRVAAFDAWTANPGYLNLTAENSFTLSTGGGSTPSGGGGGGGGGGGYNGRGDVNTP